MPAVHYDIGNNNISYFDNQVEDPNKFSSDTKSWNNGWSFRNDGVRKVEENSKEALSSFTGGINLPPGFKMPF